MDLIFFDLDGTLLNKSSQITPYTAETLALLSEKDIAFTVATGRTMLSAQQIIGEHNFALPHIYNNGVTIYDPNQKALKLDNLLDARELNTITETVLNAGVAPFINVIDEQHHHHSIYHSKPRHQVEKDLIEKYFAKTKAHMLPIESLPSHSKVTNISMIGDSKTIYPIWEYLNTFDSLVAYSGPALEGEQYSWMDVHHKLANKGTAVENLKAELGASNIICFGDSDNDLSMFAFADEAYAPSNANKAIKEKASSIIGHHHEDGVAHFLRERFSL